MMQMKNPFEYIGPEEMTAEQINHLFVELYSEFPRITRSGNVFITGARGTGKSMMIRYAMPDVQILENGGRVFSDLDCIAFHVKVKRTQINYTDLGILDDVYAPYYINEHFLSVYVLMFALKSLSELKIKAFRKKAYERFFNETYIRYLRLSNCNDEIEPTYDSANAFFKVLYNHAEIMNAQLISYMANMGSTKDRTIAPYTLPLLSFLRFIVPVFSELNTLPGFPKGKDIHIYIDDADYLSETQTKILNSWVACRTQPKISLKIASQVKKYKTFLTPTNVLVEAPHDYYHINISDLYTTKNSGYAKKAQSILKKRLELAGITCEVDSFFPVYKKQEDGIELQRQLIKENYPHSGIGNRVDDDVGRYAIPNYIKSLSGTSKNKMTYQYAGIDNIIHLSSGIVRYLLESACDMFDEVSKKHTEASAVATIPSEIQDNVLRLKASSFLFNDIYKMDIGSKDKPSGGLSSKSSKTQRLQNLLRAMGQTFSEILMSERSERKVFSIALSNQIDADVRETLELGVELGYLHESRIGNKEGTGQTELYILNRCLSPIFTLDPTGFSGYLFMTNDDLKLAISSGRRLRKIDKYAKDDENQLSLFDAVGV
jgi:hypothetical protein